MATDREIIKTIQKGQFRTGSLDTAIVDSNGAVGQLHEETFVFSNPAGSPLAEVGITMAKKCRVKSIRALSGATLAANGTNFITGTVAKRDGLGGGTTTLGSFTTNTVGGATLTAFVPTVVALSTVAGALEIAAGQVLTYALVDGGTTTEPAVAVSVTVEYT